MAEHLGPSPGEDEGQGHVKVILLDIEGTVCPISFVKDVLFPYALQALPATLASKWDSSSLAPYINAFPLEHRVTPAALTAHVKDLMSRDVKIAYLKSLQGYLWEEGYARGELKAPLFADVHPRFPEWKGQGRDVMIYSSGSVPAQKLLFAHTNGDPADLTPSISGYFDTVNAGTKQAAESYRKIVAAAGGPPPGEWLFLSDNVAEVEAALEAGMRSVVVRRPGNAELPEGVDGRLRVVDSFEKLDVDGT